MDASNDEEDGSGGPLDFWNERADSPGGVGMETPATGFLVMRSPLDHEDPHVPDSRGGVGE